MNRDCGNIFAVVDVYGKNVLVTRSAQKAKDAIRGGGKIEIWSRNSLVKSILLSEIYNINIYIQEEKDYHAYKQKQAEARNRARAIARSKKAGDPNNGSTEKRV